MQVPPSAADVEMAQAPGYESGPRAEAGSDADMDNSSGNEAAVSDLVRGRWYEDEHSQALEAEVDAAPDEEPPRERPATWILDLSRTPEQYNSRIELTDRHRVRQQQPEYEVDDLM